jgi:hypothetical protein
LAGTAEPVAELEPTVQVPFWDEEVTGKAAGSVKNVITSVVVPEPLLLEILKNRPFRGPWKVPLVETVVVDGALLAF